MWAGSLCGLSAGLKNQRMKVRHLPGPPIKKTATAKSFSAGSNPVFFQKRIGAMVTRLTANQFKCCLEIMRRCRNR